MSKPLLPPSTKAYANSIEADRFTDALRRVVSASPASSRAAIEASKLTKPSRHTRFVYAPAKDRA